MTSVSLTPTATKPRLDRGQFLHPLTLFVLVLLTSVVVFVGNLVIYAVATVGTFVLLFYAHRPGFWRQALIMLSLGVITTGIILVNYDYVTSIFLGLAVLALRLLPVFNLGSLLIISRPSALLAALRSLWVPNNLAIGVLLALRFLGEMPARLREIRLAMRVRGLRPSLWHPIRAFELYFVPLTYKCLHVSESLVSSIIAKGIEREEPRSSYHDIAFHWQDTLALGAGLAILGVAIWI